MAKAEFIVHRGQTDAKDFLDERRSLGIVVMATTIVITLTFGSLYLFANGNVMLPIVPVVAVAAVVLLWAKPQIIYHVSFAGACLFELFQYNFSDSITDRVPLFWDINTAIQIYGHDSGFHAAPVSVFEAILLLSIAFSTIRAVFDKSFSFVGGKLLVPILAYLACVFLGVIHGLGSGGDWKMALFEVRTQFYILIAYLVAVNYPADTQTSIRQLFKIAVVCIGIKGMLGTFRYFVTLGGHTIPETGIGAHEESFFFDCFCILFIVLKLADLEPQVRRLMILFMPFVVMANLFNERRAATAALVIVLPLAMFLSYRAFPNRRKFIGLAAVTLVAAIGIYLPIFWNSDSAFAQPARAIKSQFTPTDRDASSNIYRQEEDSNLMLTLKLSPVIGYGYGKPIENLSGMVDLSSVDPFILYLTHDQILWVWMRIGIVGYFVFWIFIANMLILATQTASDMTYEPSTRALSVYFGTLVLTLLIFGLFDMQLTNNRDVLFTYIIAGTLARAIEVHETNKVERKGSGFRTGVHNPSDAQSSSFGSTLVKARYSPNISAAPNSYAQISPPSVTKPLA